MAAFLHSGLLHCLFLEMQGSAGKMRVRDVVQEDKRLLNGPTFMIGQAGRAHPAAPATFNRLAGAQGSAPPSPLPSAKAKHGVRPGGSIRLSQRVGKEAFSTQRKSLSSKLGMLQGFPVQTRIAASVQQEQRL